MSKQKNVPQENAQKNNSNVIEIDGVKIELSEKEFELYNNTIQAELKSTNNGNNISVFKSSDMRHKWQKFVKKHLSTFAKIATDNEKLSKVFALSCKNEFLQFVAKYNETHINEISLEKEIIESDLRNINAANVSVEMKNATNLSVLKGLNICRLMFK